LREGGARSIIESGRSGGLTMCHDWWLKRRFEEGEDSRELWEEFERTPPLTEPEPTGEEAEVTLERPESTQLGAER
jgi:hypothetical protein